jgi:Arc/MetJ family transcription regulator
MNLRVDLVAQAREVLGTDGTTDTVHRALEEVLRQEAYRWLAAHPFETLTREEEKRLDWGLPLDGSPEPDER